MSTDLDVTVRTQTDPESPAPATREPGASSPVPHTALVGVVWLAAILTVYAINPAQAAPTQPTLLLTLLADIAFFGWVGVMVLASLRRAAAPTLGIVVGGIWLLGHLICGIEGHIPMTGAIWVSQCMLLAGATAYSGYARLVR